MTETTETATARPAFDPLKVLRSAADRIREQHRADDPMHTFWREVAGWLDGRAEWCEYSTGSKTSGDWSDFNGAVAAASSYLSTQGDPS